MKVTKLPAHLSDLVRKSESMSSYLANLSVGRKATPHSWLYEQEDSNTTLDRWIPIMEKANLENSPFGKEFNQFDRRQLSKFGPQGEVPSIESQAAQEVIEPLFSPSEFDDEDALSEYFSDCKLFAKELFGERLMRARPLSTENTVDSMRSRDTLSTNSGFPRFTRRSTVYRQEIQDAQSGKAYEYPAIILFRQYNGKLRPVWMYPMSMNLLELRFEQVLKQMIRTSKTSWIRDYVSPWNGYEDVKRTLTRQWPHAAPIVGGDTTKMDAHMRNAQMRLFYEIVKWAFQKPYWSELYDAVMHTTEIPLLVSPTTWLTGCHGLASGAGFTQLSETILTMFMAWKKGCTGQGIGDDFTWNVSLTAEEVVEYLAQFGLPANEDKQDVSTDSLTFLQRMNRQNFFSREDQHVLGGYYPTIRALNSLLNPEKFHRPADWSSDMFCVRCYMILENCVDDPCFVEFLKFVVKGQRDLIPFAKKSAKDLGMIWSKARLIPGLTPTYTQNGLEKPLALFTSIQLAKEL